jgi:hypothetical protein
MTTTSCPDFETILDYLEQKLALEEALLLESHFQTCERCPETLAETRQLLDLMREDARLVVPPQVHQTAVALFKPWFQKRARNIQSQPPFLKRLIAHLVLDSGLQPGSVAGLMAGARSSSLVNNMGWKVRQLLYSFHDGEIELDLQLRSAENQDQFGLLGQVFGLNEPIERVELALADQTLSDFVLETQVDETSTFQFGPLASGEYTLRIFCGLEVLTVDAFHI